MDNKEKKGFSSISDLSSDINEKDHSQTAEDKPSMSQTEKNELEQFEKENSSDVYLKRDSDKSNLSHSNTNKASYIKSKMKKVFIEIAYLSLGVIVIVAIVVIIEYDEYKYYQNKNKELNYATNKNWKWHNESQTIQISTEHDEIPVLRRVYMQDNKVIYASKHDDYRLRTCVHFITDCVPKSEIKTSKIFLSGEPKMLKCNSAGNILYHCEEWQDTSTNVIWSDNLDGFSFQVNFRWWDFSGIDRAITLSKVIE